MTYLHRPLIRFILILLPYRPSSLVLCVCRIGVIAPAASSFHDFIESPYSDRVQLAQKAARCFGLAVAPMIARCAFTPLDAGFEAQRCAQNWRNIRPPSPRTAFFPPELPGLHSLGRHPDGETTQPVASVASKQVRSLDNIGRSCVHVEIPFTAIKRDAAVDGDGWPGDSQARSGRAKVGQRTIEPSLASRNANRPHRYRGDPHQRREQTPALWDIHLPAVFLRSPCRLRFARSATRYCRRKNLKFPAESIEELRPSARETVRVYGYGRVTPHGRS